MTAPRKEWHHSRLRSIRYVGSKIRITPKIAAAIKALGQDALVDVFGGSGAVLMNSGYNKRVYNDGDGDIVTFFRVLTDDQLRPKLIRKLKKTPMSREIFDQINKCYKAGGQSFAHLSDLDRAWIVFFRSSFAFGGKFKNGGFGATLSDNSGCKEIKRYQSVLRDFARLADFWKGTVIENLDYERLIKTYEKRSGVVFYCDPPYISTENYYTTTFSKTDHFNLASLLTESPAAAVVSYYDCDLVRSLYLARDGWDFQEITAIKNSMGRSKAKAKVTELLISKRAQ